MLNTEQNTLGVMAMRVQVPNLHPGHRHAVESTRKKFGKVLIVLGEHGGMRTDRDPLTYAERAAMIRETYPDEQTILIDRLRDHPFDHMRWSDWLDAVVEKNAPGSRATMCASRDGFLDLYTGRHPKYRISPIKVASGTDIRKAIVHSPTMSAREAIIHHEMIRPAIAYSAADIAIVDDRNERVLAITKHWFDGLWSLPGGFVDPEKDTDDEAAARRERGEELLNIRTGDRYEQLGSRVRIEDPRYRNSKDKIYSTLFCTQYQGGVAAPGDDAKGTRWMSRDDLNRLMVPWHRPLVERLNKRWDDLRVAA